MKTYIQETLLMDYSAPAIQSLVESRGWQYSSQTDKILSIYNFVRDEIAFGYNTSDDVTASKVLKDGYGQCNTKGTLFMTLLRAVGVPCRMHGFFIDKVLQKGAMKGFYYRAAPKEILHSWVEIYYDNHWLNLEGFILDIKYLNKLQDKFKECEGSFCGYGVAISDFKNPPIEWTGGDTYIQKDGITKDLGIFDTPDELFAKYTQTIGRFKNFLFKRIIRHFMNRNIKKIREEK